MIKKFSMMLAAVAVLAFGVPSLASASAVTFPAGTLLSTTTEGAPTVIEGSGTDVILTSTLLGEITCARLDLVGILTKNDGTTVEGKQTAAEEPFQEGCTNPSGKVQVTKVNLTNLFSTGTGHTGSVAFTSTVDVGALTCELTGVNVPFTYAAGGDTLVFNRAGGITAKPANCGTIKLDGTFTIEFRNKAGQHTVVLD